MLTKKGEEAKSILGFGARKCSVGGICRWRRDWITLIIPAVPAAVSRCPTLVFTEPSAQNCLRGVSPKACVSAATSMGSPRSVPVPCPSTMVTVAGSTSPTASASSITAAWPSTLGAVKPTFWAPSLLMAEPRTTACTVSPSASASSSRFSTTRATPLPVIAPRASASKARQCPSGESTPPGEYR